MAGIISDAEIQRKIRERDQWADDKVREITAAVGANELEAATIARFEAMVRHGYKFIDIIVRKDGHEHRYQADWLARLFRKPYEIRPLTQEELAAGFAVLGRSVEPQS